ncbi:MAG: hypothetical protein ACOX9E_04435 [Lentisphaeria bacterium]|jgi:hypothetical protein
MTMTKWTDADFESLCWHDNHVHGFAIREGEFGSGQLVLDIDYILEWLCEADKTCRFMLAPADLVFQEVTNLEIRVDYKGMAMGPLSIGEIRREGTELTEQFGRYRWTIVFNFPEGEIVFLASGFVQELRAAPVESSRQCLTWQERRRTRR